MALFMPGDQVTVRKAFPPGHVRTPYYIRGKSGWVQKVLGSFANPEELAYGRDGLPKCPLYRVRFMQSNVWTDYSGGQGDTVDVELYEHWLELFDILRKKEKVCL